MSIHIHQLNRRSLLRLGAAGATAAALAPFASARADAVVVPSLSNPCGGPPVVAHSDIGGVPLYLEETLQPHIFYFEAAFYSRVTTWWQFWDANTPTTWVPAGIYSDGAYDPDPCTSQHALGKAFDLTRIYINGDGRGFNGRYDLWSQHTGANLVRARKRYWAGAASLHRFFAPVLTYPYVNGPNDPFPGSRTHEQHVHVDTTQLVGGNSVFNPVTPQNAPNHPQLQHVAACLIYIWGYQNLGLTLDSTWAEMQPYTHDVLWRIGIDGQITTPAYWRRFNEETTSYGSGA